MGKWADRESDEQRLPEGIERVGYDADTQTYSYRDIATGEYYEGEEGNRYGRLHPVGEARHPASPSAQEAQDLQIQASSREAVRHMLPFALLVLSFMLLIFYWVGFTK